MAGGLPFLLSQFCCIQLDWAQRCGELHRVRREHVLHNCLHGSETVNLLVKEGEISRVGPKGISSSHWDLVAWHTP